MQQQMQQIVSFDPRATNGARTPVPLNELSTAQAAQDVANEIGATQVRIGNPQLEYDGYQGGPVAPFWGFWNNKWISLSQLVNQKAESIHVDLPITKVAGKISKVVFSQADGRYVVDSSEDAPKTPADNFNPSTVYEHRQGAYTGSLAKLTLEDKIDLILRTTVSGDLVAAAIKAKG